MCSRNSLVELGCLFTWWLVSCCVVLPAAIRVVQEPDLQTWHFSQLLLPNQMIWHPPQLLTLLCPLISTHKLTACSSPLPRQSYRPCHCSFARISLLDLLDDFREISVSSVQSSYYVFHGEISLWGEQSEWIDTWQDSGMQDYSTLLKQWKSSYRTQIKGKIRLLYFYCVWAILYFL